MPRSDRFLKFLTLISFIGFTVFALVVTVSELRSPDHPLTEIAEKHCSSVKTTAAVPVLPGAEKIPVVPESEQDTGLIRGACLFIHQKHRDATDFTTAIDLRDRLFEHTYLYRGTTGILIKKTTAPLQQYADELYACFRKGECTVSDEIRTDRLSITIAYSKNDTYPLTVSFLNRTLPRIINAAQKLLPEMLAVKGTDPRSHDLEFIFHRPPEYIDDLPDTAVRDLIVPGRDGLFLSSRGAEIRLLPHETVSSHLSLLDRKGRQYGLEKHEYKKEIASLYFLRTVRFREQDGVMRPFTGFSFAHKSDYSPRIMTRFLAGWIIANQRSDGAVNDTVDVRTGEPDKKDGKLFTQVRALEALSAYMHTASTDAFTRGTGYDLRHAINTLRDFIVSRLEKAHPVTRFFFYRVLKQYETVISPPDSDTVRTFLTSVETQIDIAVTENRRFPVPKQYAGIFYRAVTQHPDFYRNQQYANYISTVLQHIPEHHPEDLTDRKKFYTYLLPFIVRHNVEPALSAAAQTIAEFRSQQSFPEIAGAFTPNPEETRPGAISTARIGRALAVSRHINPTVTETWFSPGSPGIFLRFAAVTSDDTDIWKDAAAKKYVLGGIRSHTGSTRIRLSATASALLYFIMLPETS